jgi:Ca2+-binding EF-hand superfamily protein
MSSLDADGDGTIDEEELTSGLSSTKIQQMISAYLKQMSSSYSTQQSDSLSFLSA